MINPVDGHIFAVDKPLGWSSFHVVKKLRGALLARLRRVGVRKLKVGHAGTLDPLATGVMLLCTGKATRQIDALQAGRKIYTAEIALGATTPSFDLETPVDATFPTAHITRELVDETLRRFIGRIEQVPPSYSACKVDGKRAYALARKGEDPGLKPKVLVIDDISLLSFSPELITIRVVCSKGTYIRALARDIGTALGSGGYLASLRREGVGDYLIEGCLGIEEVEHLVRTSPMAVTAEDGSLLEVPPLTEAPPRMSTLSQADILPWNMRIKPTDEAPE